MTRSGAEYVRGLRDGRTVLLNGERVADVTTHPAFAAGVRTVVQLYDLAHDPSNRELMTYPSPRDGRPTNKCWLVPRTREDLVARRRAIKYWADASYGFVGRSPDHVASFFAGFAGASTSALAAPSPVLSTPPRSVATSPTRPRDGAHPPRPWANRRRRSIGHRTWRDFSGSLRAGPETRGRETPKNRVR